MQSVYSLVSLLGLIAMLALAWALSEDRTRVPWRLIAWGLGLQLVIGLLLLPTPLQTYVFAPLFRGAVSAATLGRAEVTATPGELVFVAMRGVVGLITGATKEGASFVFGRLADDPSFGATMAFQVLPVIILVSALSGILFHLGVIQAVVRGMAWLMRRSLRTSGAETFGAALLVFLGIESTTAIGSYVPTMTRSELCTVMSAFMATIAGSVMVAYSTMGAEPGHLLAASLMSAPAAILVSKLMVPEKEKPQTSGEGPIALEVQSRNLVDAAAQGTNEGLRMALSVGAMLIAFIGLVSLCNTALSAVSGPLLRAAYLPWAASAGLPPIETVTLEGLFGVVFAPFALLIGVPWSDVPTVAGLIGTKSVVNEFLAYAQLQEVGGQLTVRGHTLAMYALCGFANPGSVGIVIAGLQGLAPERRTDIVELGLKSYVAGTLACFMTACVAGVLL